MAMESVLEVLVWGSVLGELEAAALELTLSRW